MNRSERTVLVVLLLLLLAGLLFWRVGSGPKAPAPNPAEVKPSSATVPSPLAAAPKEKPKSALPTTTPTGAPVPPKLELHKELIPKNIEIVRCYYTQEVAPPGTTFGFDINGSGFTSEFEKMIKVESGHEHVDIQNLHLITTNQIHGDMKVGAKARTGFVYPRVLIKGLPVFRAPDPFAVVRKGEVLTVFFISMEENGRGGNFRVITNIDDNIGRCARDLATSPDDPAWQQYCPNEQTLTSLAREGIER